ncbi:MAG: FAD-binding oxidoreductase [Drouetiella hepatica Uher 2000/2452]|jgi:lycopene cyclase CruP|uniref:FAD-binding oxidoreductase n=1 Tax=Drouetiella hepatica Uher 2000/2452 TaxID=904376 RepID=A0A951QDW7_9CYAN|nr:FAD-binding oxidoreductase [Drouetiella hepatica Uher 2000/2452]
MSLTEQILSQMPGNPFAGLRQADRLWQAYREAKIPPSEVVQETSEPLAIDWDVVICGGTLGILIGAALAQRGWRVAVLERGKLRGRDQEWNISRRELQALVELGLLTEAELEGTIATTYNPGYVRFHEGIELQVTDVLNIGVDPVELLDTLKTKFLAAGGQLFEDTAFKGAVVHPNGVTVQVAETLFTTRLLLDAMGHFSPVTQQARQGRSPDAVCLVVGTCAQGFPENPTGDLFATFTTVQNQCQYFWEAFPARDGRTTYLFTYLDAQPERPSLETLFESYFQLLPQYQGIELDRLQFQRALFGFFPCYRQSPLKPAWNRILPIGDSSGNQSPLSFGGFGAMIRHLKRLTAGIDAALAEDLLDRSALALLHPYQPSLAVTWLFQRSMSVGIHQKVAPNQINALLSAVFEEMQQLGDRVLKPFLQDVVQFSALAQTMLRVAIAHPCLILAIIPHVGLLTLLTWMGHFLALGLYAALCPLALRLKPWTKSLPTAWQYYGDRWLEALQYGSGNDYP